MKILSEYSVLETRIIHFFKPKVIQVRIGNPGSDRNDHACLVQADSAIEQAVDEIQCVIEEQNGEDIFAEEEGA